MGCEDREVNRLTLEVRGRLEAARRKTVPLDRKVRYGHFTSARPIFGDETATSLAVVMGQKEEP